MQQSSYLWTGSNYYNLLAPWTSPAIVDMKLSWETF